MNFAIISNDENSNLNSESLKESFHFKIKGEFLIQRTARIAINCGAKKLFFILQERERELKKLLETNSFGVPVDIIIKSSINTINGLFTLAPLLYNEPFCMVNRNLVFDETEFKDFINYSSLQSNADGIIAVTRYSGKINSDSVAMDDEDNIIKFSNSSEGYNWTTGGINYFTPKIFNELQYAIDAGILRLRNFFRLLVDNNFLLKGISFSKIINIHSNAEIEKAKQFLSLNHDKI